MLPHARRGTIAGLLELLNDGHGKHDLYWIAEDLQMEVDDLLPIVEATGASATFLPVELTLVLAALWTVPVGAAVGLRPRLSAFVQPIAQVAASVPATASFPIVLMFLIRIGGGLGAGSIILLLLGTQWYVLFNIIAGASAIPTDLKEVYDVFRVSRVERWRRLLLPGIFRV